MTWMVLFVIFLVAINGFFVAAEFALVKVRASEIEAAAANGGAAQLARKILGSLDRYLSACQLGITLASLGLGWVGEPVVARMIEPLFAAAGLPEDKVHIAAFPIAFLIITLLHLTVGEQAPKIGAIQKARATTLFIAYPLAVFYSAFKPFIWLINVTSNAMLRMVGLEAVSEHERVITEDEVRTILMQSAAMGHIPGREREIMVRVLDLGDKIARGHMVPRHEIVHLNKLDPMQKKLAVASDSGHSRFPLCDGDLDNIVGIVHVKDVFKTFAADGEPETLTQFARDALFLPETIELDRLLREFQRSKNHMCILVDEYGVVSGMITLENVIEEMVGSIEDEFDAEVPLILKKGDGRFEVDAACSVDDLRDRCSVEVPEETRVDTVGGIMTEALHRIPTVGDTVTVGGHLLTVLESERTRVTRVLVEEVRPSATAKDEANDPCDS